MREILPGIFTWGSTYADRPWDLNGYAIRLTSGVAVIDPPAPEGGDWTPFDALTPITRVILTNRDHLREAEAFRSRYRARLIAGAEEIAQLAPMAIDRGVHEGELIGNAFRVLHLPGKSPGEITLYLEPAHYALSREVGGILLIGDAVIGHPPGALGLIPEAKLDNPPQLRESLRKLLALDFQIMLLCDGEPVLHRAKDQLAAFLVAC